MTLEDIQKYCRLDRRVCPMPPAWAKLHSILRGYEIGNEAPSPLILGSWFATNAEKKERLCNQLIWAFENGCLDEVVSFLKSLKQDQWYRF